MHRPLVFFVLAVTAACGAVAACESFEEGNPVTEPDGAADAPNDSGGSGDTGSNDATTAPFCAAKRDAGIFCFDFDTDPLTPTWVPITSADGGIATITVEDAASASPPNAGYFVVKQTGSGLIESTAVLSRSADQVDVAQGIIELDVAIGEVSAASSVAFVAVSSTLDSGAFAGCFFGMNADPQGGASLFVTSKAVDGGVLASSRTDVLTNKFTHVVLGWHANPPKVTLTVGSASYELPADDCVRSTAFSISFGPQAPLAPVESRMYLDNITYDFKP